MERSGLEEYSFLVSLVRLLGARRVLEIGTSAGDGALALAGAAAHNGPDPAAEVVTIDIADQREPECRNHVGPVPIRFIQGDSAQVLERMVAGGERFDLVFIDGNHHFDAVRRDWEFSSNLTDTVLFHDALQFSGVSRVVQRIRRSADWDVAVLSYPGITNPETGERTGRCPGLALATRRRRLDEVDRNVPERPTPRSRRAFLRRKERFAAWHGTANRADDLSLADWEMLFHYLWNFGPQEIVHLGHAGTGASLLFLDYARAKKAYVTLADPTGTFWPRKEPLLPDGLQSVPMTVRVGSETTTLEAATRGPVLYWVDEYTDEGAYDVARRLAGAMGPGDAMCVRNCSETDGGRGFVCTCDPAREFLAWAEAGQYFSLRLASSRAVFGDYVNAGHWLVLQTRNSA